MSLNDEKICCKNSGDKIAVCERAAVLRSGKFSDLNSVCKKALVSMKIFQLQDMLDKNRFLDTFWGHSKRPNILVTQNVFPSWGSRKCVSGLPFAS